MAERILDELRGAHAMREHGHAEIARLLPVAWNAGLRDREIGEAIGISREGARMRRARAGATECGFCHGRPVGNAASWVDGKPRPPAACPRCGKTATSSEEHQP